MNAILPSMLPPLWSGSWLRTADEPTEMEVELPISSTTYPSATLLSDDLVGMFWLKTKDAQYFSTQSHGTTLTLRGLMEKIAANNVSKLDSLAT